MKTILAIIQKKPPVFIFLSLIYLTLVIFMKWGIKPNLDAIWFAVGGVIGMYFLDLAEEFFHLTPSPFRSIVFIVGFILVSLFVVTSSGSTLASGLVLSLYLVLILWQIGEWQITRNLNNWYRMINGVVGINIQKWILTGFILVFLLESYLFIK